MKILTTSTGTQSLKLIAREGSQPFTLTLIDKNTRVESIIPVSPVINDGCTILYGSFNLRENATYSIILSNNDGILYKDTVYCTDQTDYNKFDLHKDEYITEDSRSNQFIVL